MVLVWCWYAIGMVLVLHWDGMILQVLGILMASVSLCYWYDIGMVLVWYWYFVGMALVWYCCSSGMSWYCLVLV